MGRISWSWLLLGLLLLGGVGLMVWVVTGYRNQAEERVGMETPSSHPMAIKGLVFSNYEGDRLQSRVKADQLLVKPRQFSVFRIKSVNEVVLTNTFFEIYQYPAEKGSAAGEERFSLGAQLTSGVKGLAGLKGMGRVTRAVLLGMKMEVLNSGHPHLRLSAQNAEMSINKAEMQMENVLIENPVSGKRLISKVVIWDEKNRVFVVPGEYRLQTPGGISVGKNVAVDLNLQILAGNGDGEPGVRR